MNTNAEMPEIDNSMPRNAVRLYGGACAGVEADTLRIRRRARQMGGIGGTRGRPVDARKTQADDVLQLEGGGGIDADDKERLGYRGGVSSRHDGAMAYEVPALRRVSRDTLFGHPLRVRRERYGRA